MLSFLLYINGLDNSFPQAGTGLDMESVTADGGVIGVRHGVVVQVCIEVVYPPPLCAWNKECGQTFRVPHVH